MMSLARIAGALLVIAGAGAGTLLDRPPARTIPRVNGQFVLSADLHVHAFVGDGGVPPWELAREARRKRLDVIVVTNHNQRLAARIAARAAPPDGPVVIVGQEVTAPSFHLVAAGIHETVDWWLPAAQAIAAVHAQGGVAIAAHPSVMSWRPRDTETLASLDGAEVAHASGTHMSQIARERVEFFRDASARNRSLAPIGSSDFHFGGTMGQCRTFVFANEVTAAGVFDAIRDARTVAYDGHGRLTGDPSRVRIVEALLAADPPPRQPDFLSRLAAWSSLAGLLVLLLWK